MTGPKHTKRPTTLTDLPPELLAAIASELPTASSLSSLARTSKSLHAFVDKDGWTTFARTRFPTLCPRDTPLYRDTARTLTTLSKAWDKRAFVARYVEPRGNIIAHPGARRVDRWKRPRGQTIGFTPQIDVHEVAGPTWHDRDETLAFSAGAEICIRHTHSSRASDNVHWTTYRPHSAAEGRDDVTTLHLVHSERGHKDGRLDVVTGTANGDLQLLRLPTTSSASEDVSITYFTTQGLPVRSSSLYQDSHRPALLAANLGDTRIALYSLDSCKNKISPSSQIDIQPSLRADGNPAPNHRAWVTTFLSPSTLAVGVGPSEQPVQIYQITKSGLSQAPLRKFALLDTLEKRINSAVYTTLPLPSGIASRGDGNVFLSGAYDGVVRLHDMRSRRDVEQSFVDPADDSPVYSILPRGREKLMTGASRHNILKVFDLRLGAKCYNFLDVTSPQVTQDHREAETDYNIFLRPNNQSFTARGANWSQGRNRSAESSVYSLASSSFTSPYVYAGVENAIWSLAFTEILDMNPDPAYFQPWSAEAESQADHQVPRVDHSKEVLSLAMYNQHDSMKLAVQRGLWETWRACAPRRKDIQSRLDERWKGANEFGP